MFHQQLFQMVDIVVVNRASSLCDRRLQTVAESFAHLGLEILPSGVTVLARDHQLRVTLRERQVDGWQMRPCPRNGGGVACGDVSREFLRLFLEGLERRARGE